LGDENLSQNPLITPCKCGGTMGFIHIDCLREWLNSKSSSKQNSAVKTYCWKALECELCKQKFPDKITSESGVAIDLISFEKP
jgi:E3 ubiquitin-protein ligase DOA10